MLTMPTIEGVNKWHRTYDDPRDGIVLISREGTGVSVSSRLITKHSLWFKNQLAQPIVIEEDIKPDVNPKTVQTKLYDATLELFFDLITVNAQQLILSSLSLYQCYDLLKFSEQYQCHDLIPKLGSQLPLSVEDGGDPSYLFLFAAARNDWGLARQALQKMDVNEVRILRDGRLHLMIAINYGLIPAAHGAASNIDRHTEGSTSTMKVETLADFLALLPQQWRAVLTTLILTKSYQQGTLVDDWSTIAKDFVKPVEPAGKRKNSEAHAEGSKKTREV